MAGLKIADGAKLNEAVKMVVAAAMKTARPEIAQMVKLDAETYQGIHLHVVSIAATMLPPNPQDVFTKAFGEKAELVLGISDDRVYAAYSSDGVKTLKGLIDKCKAAPGTSTALVQIFSRRHADRPVRRQRRRRRRQADYRRRAPDPCGGERTGPRQADGDGDSQRSVGQGGGRGRRAPYALPDGGFEAGGVSGCSASVPAGCPGADGQASRPGDGAAEVNK